MTKRPILIRFRGQVVLPTIRRGVRGWLRRSLLWRRDDIYGCCLERRWLLGHMSRGFTMVPKYQFCDWAGTRHERRAEVHLKRTKTFILDPSYSFSPPCCLGSTV